MKSQGAKVGEEGESKNDSGDERGQGRKEVDGTEAQITILGENFL